jgi:hypothetical protein
MTGARTLLAAVLFLIVPAFSGAEPSGTRPLIGLAKHETERAIPPETTLLEEPQAIERFLAELDGQPPDWGTVLGHHEGSHDARLFALNRERDAARAGKAGLGRRVTFLWDGELSGYEAALGGYRVAIGPRMIPTAWGLVRFKPEGLPATLVAGPPPALKEFLKTKQAAGGTVTIAVAMTGRLVPEESIVYDMAHGETGRGLIMPVVLVERLDYLYFQDQ